MYLSSRGFSSELAPDRKVAILGAAGGIVQPLSLLMKLNPLVSRLTLYDISGTPDVATDFIHVNTRSELPNVSGLSNFSLQVDKGSYLIDGDVDIGGNEPHVTSCHPVLIDKDTGGRTEECNEAG